MTPQKKTKLILSGGFISMILLTVVLGVGALRISHNLIQVNAALLNHPFVVSNTLRDIKLDILEIHRVMSGAVHARYAEDFNDILTEIHRRENRIAGSIDLVEERYLGDIDEVRSARRAIADWKGLRNRVLGLIQARQYDQALGITQNEGPAQIDLISRRLDVLLAFAHNKAAEFRAEGERSYWQNEAVLIGMISVVVITGGIVAGFVFYMINKVEKGLAEKEELIRQSQKMEAVGQLTGGLAHDLNNVLTVFSMNLGMLEEKAADNPGCLRHIKALQQGFTRAADLTRKLLDFSRTRPREAKRVSVNEFIAGLEDLITKSLTPAIDLRMDLAPDAWTVDIDPGDLETALLNLALNARDAMPDGGTLVIETANKQIDENYVERNPGASAGDFLLISVSDTGTGMTSEDANKAFEPFFTTKDVGSGTGLGLSMVYSFIQRSGGHVKIYSEPGEGTAIRLYLPRARGAVDEPEAQGLAAQATPGGGETILVVDDEQDLLDAAVSYLQSLGYRTFSAANGGEALEILDRESSVDLLFSDVVMPGGIDGYQLAVEAVARRPGLRVLLTSGFSRKREKYANGERRLVSDLAKTLLSKPYNLAELAAAVRRALASEVS
jgi:signal transduction histidine kinase